MRNSLLILTLICVTLSCRAQGDGAALKAAGKLEAAMFAFGAEFMKDPTNTDKAYELTKTLALVNQIDTAFFFLNVALQNNQSLRVLTESELYALTTNEKWSMVEQMQMKKYQEKNGALKDPQLALKLIRMIMKDQALGYQLHKSREFYQKEGYGPHWMYSIGLMKRQLNEQNYKELQEIVKAHGWPTYSMVGELAADALLLVVNHHEEEAVRKKYLSAIKSACESGEGSCMEYAKIHDRILVNEGKEQLYGMQFQYNSKRKLEPFPIENPEQVDKRRKAIGLEPLAEYLKRKINFDWKVEQK